WVGIYSVGAADSQYATRFYTTGRSTDSALYTVPSGLAPGTYEMRLFANDTLTRLAVGNPFSVAAGATLTANPLSVATGGTLSMKWAGIAAPTATDWIAMVPVN